MTTKERTESCIECGKPIWPGSHRCKPCAHKGYRGSMKLALAASQQQCSVYDLLYTLRVVKQMTIDQMEDILGTTAIEYHLKHFSIRSTGRYRRTLNIPSNGWIHQGVRWISVNGKEMLEHRYIMEQILGRTLQPDEVVHHKNKDRLDNRPENLELMTRSQHSTHHDRGKPRKGQKRSPVPKEVGAKISATKKSKHQHHSAECKARIAATMRRVRQKRFWSSKVIHTVS